jgi:hypothetical protein
VLTIKSQTPRNPKPKMTKNDQKWEKMGKNEEKMKKNEEK